MDTYMIAYHTGFVIGFWGPPIALITSIYLMYRWFWRSGR